MAKRISRKNREGGGGRLGEGVEYLFPANDSSDEEQIVEEGEGQPSLSFPIAAE